MNNFSYVGEVQIIKESEFFKYNVTYPVLKLYKECIYHSKFKQEIINNINYDIYKDVIDFKNSIRQQSIEYKKLYENELYKKEEGVLKYQYEAYVTYNLHYDKNNIISITLTKYEFTGGAHGMTYLDAFNYNLLDGKKIKLEDLFKDDVNYKKIINDFINNEISKNQEEYFKGEDGFKGISENQSFYIEEDGIVIYFSLYEIAPYYVGIPRFKLKYDEIKDYLNIDMNR